MLYWYWHRWRWLTGRGGGGGIGTGSTWSNCGQWVWVRGRESAGGVDGSCVRFLPCPAASQPSESVKRVELGLRRSRGGKKNDPLIWNPKSVWRLQQSRCEQKSRGGAERWRPAVRPSLVSQPLLPRPSTTPRPHEYGRHTGRTLAFVTSFTQRYIAKGLISVRGTGRRFSFFSSPDRLLTYHWVCYTRKKKPTTKS